MNPSNPITSLRHVDPHPVKTTPSPALSAAAASRRPRRSNGNSEWSNHPIAAPSPSCDSNTVQSVDAALLEPAPASKQTAVRAEEQYVLNATIVYQDLATREWATEIWGRVTELAGKEGITAAAWRISDLARPAILAEAVQAAACADVVVAAVSAAEELPSGLFVWFDLWLPRRTRGPGALVALIGLPEAGSDQTSHAQEYFQAVARKGRMDFFSQEQTLTAASLDRFNLGAIVERADTRTPVRAGTAGGGDNAYPHGGMNE